MKLSSILIFLFVVTITVHTASADIKVAPYYSNISATPLDLATTGLFGDAIGYDFLAGGHANRIIQTGSITQVIVNTANLSHLTNFHIKIWAKDEGTGLYSVRSDSGNIRYAITGAGITTITLPTPLSAYEGDYYGVYMVGDGASYRSLYVSASSSAVLSNVKYINNAPTSGFNWIDGVGTSTNTMMVDLLMSSVDIVWIGDSIISGTPLNVAFTNQWEATITSYPINYPTTIEYKFGTAYDYSYQNVGIHGDTFPNMYNRFQNDVIIQSPEYAIIEGGVNNLVVDATAETVFAYIQDEIELCQANSITPVVILVLPAYGYLSSAQSLEADDLNDLILNYNSINTNFIIVDARDDLGTYSAVNGWSLDAGYKSDAVHLNEAGNALLAEVIFNSLPPKYTIHVKDEATFTDIQNFTAELYGADYYFTYSTTAGVIEFFNEIDPGEYTIRVSSEDYSTRAITVSSVGDYTIYLPLSVDSSLIKFSIIDYTNVFRYSETQLIITKPSTGGLITVSSIYFDAAGVNKVYLIEGDTYYLQLVSGTSEKSLAPFVVTGDESITLVIGDIAILPEETAFGGFSYEINQTNESVTMTWDTPADSLVGNIEYTIWDSNNTEVYHVSTVALTGTATYIYPDNTEQFKLTLSVPTIQGTLTRIMYVIGETQIIDLQISDKWYNMISMFIIFILAMTIGARSVQAGGLMLGLSTAGLYAVGMIRVPVFWIALVVIIGIVAALIGRRST